MDGEGMPTERDWLEGRTNENERMRPSGQLAALENLTEAVPRPLDAGQSESPDRQLSAQGTRGPVGETNGRSEER